MLEGIDISSRITDAGKVARRAAFIYQKATDGVGTPSAVIVPNANALRAEGAGDVLGAYHFLRVRHGRPQDADEQCKEFLAVRREAGCPLISWLDVELGEEGSSNRAATKDEVRAAVVLFLDTWHDCTEDPLAWYSSPGEANVMGLVLIPELALLPLALADYESTYHVPASLPSPPAFWQYQGTTPFDGVAGGADLTRFLGSLDVLRAMSAGVP
ncbi:MAG: GH25 family lysozyme [Solirubrobacterales bacterium]